MSLNIIAKSTPKHNRIIAWLTGLLTLLLAVFAFVLSFNALTDLATQHGVSIPPLFPFVVEFAVIIFSLNALHRSLTGQAAKWQWTLIILSSLLAGTFNIAHAQADILSRAMAAMPSLFLLLSFESFLSLVRFSVTRQNAIVTLQDIESQIVSKRTEHNNLIATMTKEIEQKQLQLDKIQNAIEAAKTDKNTDFASMMQAGKQAVITERRQHVKQLHSDGLQANDILDAIGDNYGIKDVRTIKNDIKVIANGNGKVQL